MHILTVLAIQYCSFIHQEFIEGLTLPGTPSRPALEAVVGGRGEEREGQGDKVSAPSQAQGFHFLWVSSKDFSDPGSSSAWDSRQITAPESTSEASPEELQFSLEGGVGGCSLSPPRGLPGLCHLPLTSGSRRESAFPKIVTASFTNPFGLPLG